MKKIISLVIAAMMAVSMFAVTVPAMAANVSSPTAATLEEGKAQTLSLIHISEPTRL